MASINGWQLKGVKTFAGMEWDGAQGNIYYNGKKVGWYSDYGNGGSAEIDISDPASKAALDSAIKSYYAKYPLEAPYSNLTPDAEIFMSDLLSLMDKEKQFKSMANKGYPYTVFYKEVIGSPIERLTAFRSEKGRENFIAQHNFPVYRTYSSLDDFVIVA